MDFYFHSGFLFKEKIVSLPIIYEKYKSMKRKLFSLLMLTFINASVFGQQFQSGGTLSKANVEPKSISRAVCEFDYLEYAGVKNLNPSTVGVLGVQNSSTTVLGLAQWFDAPQAVEIYGAAFLYNGNAGTATVKVYASNADKEVLAELGSVVVNYAGTAATSVAYGEAEFASPIIVNGPYFIAIENQSTTVLLRMATNDADLFSGRGESLSYGKLDATTWMPVNDIYEDGYDADIYLEPLVSYEVNATINHSVTSPFCVGTTDVLSATYSPIVNSRFYNRDILESILTNTPAPAPTYWTYLTAVEENVATVNVTPTTAGTYPVELIVAYNRFFPASEEITMCGVIEESEIIVNAVDDASFSYSSSTVCAGGTDLTPTITTAGGTFTTTGALIIDAATGVVDVANSPNGTFTISYTTNGTCPETATQSLTITSAPSAEFTLSSNAVCSNGSNVTANVTGSVGVFSSTTGLNINGSTGEINVATSTPGSYVITNTIAASGSCPEVTHTETIEIQAAENASFTYSANAFCEDGTNPTITIAGTGGTFTSTSGLIINGTTGELDIAASTVGTYIVTNTLAASGACPEVTATQTVVINANPTATTTVTGATISVNQTTGATYQWVDCADDSDIAGATSSTFAPSAPGSYKVVVTVGGCSTTSTCMSVDNVSVGSVAMDNVLVFPNPATDVLTVSGLTGNATLTVVDVNGKVIFTAQENNATAEISLVNVESGVYFITIASDKVNGTKRFIKK